MYFKTVLALSFLFLLEGYTSDNQTPTVSPVYSEDSLPFTISLEQEPFILPFGLQSGVFAVKENKWLFLAGRKNGLHGFSETGSFPPDQQNRTVYVVDIESHRVYSRDLDHEDSGLNIEQVDRLSATNSQFFQHHDTLYFSGGYGINSTTGDFETKSFLTAIDISQMIEWVVNPKQVQTAASAMRQVNHPCMQVTGGQMFPLDSHLRSVMVFGHNFTGNYSGSANGKYVKKAQLFQIIDNGRDLRVQTRKSENPNSAYRRRDLNVLPMILGNKRALVGFSGVFTEKKGCWTVPVEIYEDGTTNMDNPLNSETFKQSMNIYTCASSTIYSPSLDENYFILLGGITFRFFNGLNFETDSRFPFNNQITTIRRESSGDYKQYFMNDRYPVIKSTGPNPGNELLFGATAFFIASNEMPQYANNVINLDKIKSPTVIGYVVGGIMSTLPNGGKLGNSSASPYIFRLTLHPK